MDTPDERYRLRHFVHGEMPQTLYDEINLRCDDPRAALAAALSVVELVVTHTSEDWPDEQYWRQCLPEWLMSTFWDPSPAEVQAIRASGLVTDRRWHFGSWLEWMREREWEWWSSSCDCLSGTVTVRVTVPGFPSPLAALRHLFTAAGCQLVSGRLTLRGKAAG